MLSINVSKLNKSAIRARQTSFTTTGAIWSIWAKAILVLSELWKLCLPVKAAMWNQKRLAALFTCFGKVYIPLDSSTRSKENLEPCSRLCKVGSTEASEKKSTWKADFGPLILWLFLLETQETKANLQSKGSTDLTRRFWGAPLCVQVYAWYEQPRLEVPASASRTHIGNSTASIYHVPGFMLSLRRWWLMYPSDTLVR